MPICKALIQQGPRKGTICGKNTEDDYCIKHIRCKILDKATAENIVYCDISRGCFTILESHQSKCARCLHRARIHDRKREDKKRQDPNLCLDCAQTLTSDSRAIGKHGRLLRRCKPCYEKLLKYESSRSPRERNYKSEAFINKHVIWNQYVRGAKKRGLNFTIGKTLFNTLITEPCFYCGHTNKAEVNGIDRIDNNRGYEEGNIIPCCEICNTAKRSQHPLEFIDKLAAIYEFATSSTPIRSETIEKWKLTYLTRNIPKYTMYLESARKRNIEFCLTNDQFSSIIMSPCYLCGIPSNTIHTNGIDRFNNLKGYTIDNSRACCGHCNIMKGNLLYEDIMRIAKSISSNYSRLVTFFSEISIPVRTSNIMPRIKLDNPICPDIITTTHKPINEVILPNTDSTITDLLIDYNRMKVHQPPKQWKIKQIREAILSGNEHLYKEYCEEHNISAKGNDWDNTWNAFITNVKECTSDDCSKVIQQFICSLRRNRHTELCYAKNAKIVERPDRQKWPSSTIVRAFLDGKISEFKKYIDTNGCDQEKWNEFISSLEDNKHNRGALVQLCSKFLATMRIRRYRCKK